jgi:hypothetical protein
MCLLPRKLLRTLERCRMKPYLLLIVTAVAPPLPPQASPTSENIHKWSFWWESNKKKNVLKIAMN